MSTMKLWDEFEKTGKIEDYLKYTKLDKTTSKAALLKSYREEYSEELAMLEFDEKNE